MTDNPNRNPLDDAKRIDVDLDRERRAWAERFGVSEERLRQACEETGPMSNDVAGWLFTHGDIELDKFADIMSNP